MELRQGNPYIVPREKRLTDPKFYTKQQKHIYDEVYQSYENMVCPQKYITMEKMTSNLDYFGETKDYAIIWALPHHAAPPKLL